MMHTPETGDFYPAVVAQIERHDATGMRRYKAFEITAYGTSRRYQDEAFAYRMARQIARDGKWPD